MKTITNRALALACMVLAILGAAASAQADTRAEMRAEVRFFYDELAPYGHWVDHHIYGVVWVPESGVPNWHPYTYGRWVWTADYGWYWESDEDFGWATYHYGRWVLTAEYGWVWAPDDVWGPAWVDWRYSDEGYVGWAPMPPEWEWRNNAIVTARVDLGAPDYEGYWVFVSNDSFARGEIRDRRLATADMRLRLRASQRVTSYSTVKGRVYSRGVDVVKLRASTKLRLPEARVKVTESFSGGARAREAGTVTIYRPRLTARSKLNLEADLPARIDTDIDAGVRARGGDAPEAADTDADVSVDSGARGAVGGRIDTGPAPNIGIGGGIGVGGGLRIGR